MSWASRCAAEHSLWWRVLERNQSRGRNGQGTRPSEYSLLACLECRRIWRTKAPYVSRKRDASAADRRELFGPRR